MDRVLQKRRATTLPRRSQMTTISDLPRNLVEEILSRVPITSLRAVRFTCKAWNVLSKTRILCKAEATDQSVGFMMKEYRVCSMRFDLRGILNEEGEEFVDPSIKEIGGNFLNQVEISKVFHCDGLLLCVTRDKTRLVVWNPYLGQTRWIEPRNNFHRLDRYALGYDENRNHKILRFLDDDLGDNIHVFGYEIYDISSNSWRVLDITPKWDTEFFQRGVSLKGNTYFFAKEKTTVQGVEIEEPRSSLLCFDFTSERFGQFLPLPFYHDHWDTGSMCSLRDEKLAALCQGLDTNEVEIWVTTKIEPNAVSWIPFLKVDMEPFLKVDMEPFLEVDMEPEPFPGFGFNLSPDGASFFIDEEKKTAVVFDIDEPDGWEYSPCHQAAYIIGENGCLKKVDLGERQDRSTTDVGDFYPLVCSYVPSLAQINQAT